MERTTIHLAAVFGFPTGILLRADVTDENALVLAILWIFFLMIFSVLAIWSDRIQSKNDYQSGQIDMLSSSIDHEMSRTKAQIRQVDIQSKTIDTLMASIAQHLRRATSKKTSA